MRSRGEQDNDSKSSTPGARAIVSYVSVHGHRVLSIGARANDSLVLVHGLKCSKFRHKGHYVLGLGALATAF